MNRYTDELKLKLAWQAAYELRTCPPDEILLAEPIDENLRKHLAICHLCRDRRALNADERQAWDMLKSRFAAATVQPAIGTARQSGQVWTINSKAGGWDHEGRYLNPPAVLLLEEQQTASRWKVAQLYQDKRLIGQGDVELGDSFGFAQAWNCYQLADHMLDKLIGCVTQEQLAKVLSLSDAAPEEVIGDFRQMELDIAKYVAACATVPVSAKQPEPHASIFEVFARLFTPARIAAFAAMVVAVISLVILNDNGGQTPQIAQVPKPLTTESGAPTASPQPKPITPEKTKRPVQQLTLMASADVVMLSKGIGSIESLEFTRSSQDTADTGNVAFKIGIAFINLVAADKKGDASAKIEAAAQLEHLLPIISGKQTIKLPEHVGERRTLEAFTREIEQAASRSGQLVSLRFGSWLQSLRIADDEQLLQSIDPATVEHFKAELEKQKSISSVMPIFNKLQIELGGKVPKVHEVRDHLDELYDVF